MRISDWSSDVCSSDLIVVMAIFGLFFNAVMPQFEAMTLTALGRNANDYGRIRLWGSIGFLVVAGSYGALLDRLGDASFPWLSLLLLAAPVWASTLPRNDPAPARIPDPAHAGPLWPPPGIPESATRGVG